jgi:hypothetical protein
MDRWFYMPGSPGIFLCIATLSLAATMASAQHANELDKYNVVWNQPSKDSFGSMPLGNGDIGLNVWVEENGDLVFYIGKTDAWSENCRLLKLGRVRLRFRPNPLTEGGQFLQVLHLWLGEIRITAIRGNDTLLTRIWVDASRPVVRVEAQSNRGITTEASVELWRTEPRQLQGSELFSAYGLSGAPYPVVCQPDTVIEEQRDRIIWYHRNQTSIWEDTLRRQGMECWIGRDTDPLLHRTFGGLMKGTGMVRISPTKLRSKRPSTRQLISVYCLTAQTPTSDDWVRRLEEVAHQVDKVDLEQARREHRKWWADFWSRSWIRVRGPITGPKMTPNELPLRIGACSEGANQFLGYVARVRVWSRGLKPEEIEALAHDMAAPPPRDGLLVDLNLGQRNGAGFQNAAGNRFHARVIGHVESGELRGVMATRFVGQGWVEVPDDPALRLTDAVTADAWIAPAQLGPGGGRIIDKTKAGTSNGYMLDTFPHNSLRMIIEPRTLSFDARLLPGQWAHVAGSYDSGTGEERLYLNGKLVASADLAGSTYELTQGYVLQRFVSACAGRGSYPIKFNGSIFTVDAFERDQKLDADYRRWGGPYWFQNTRLVYWPMLASGDFDLMRPLFEMYRKALPFCRQRTKVYFDHEGAFFPETMYFWGAYATDNYGWDRTGKHVSQVDNTFIRWYWCGGLELCAMMLDYYAFTGDEDFAQHTLLPIATAVVEFYDKHHGRDGQGRLLLKPAQALETWQDVVNPLPDIAGLKFVLNGLLALPEKLVAPTIREQWERLLKELPPLPTTQVQGKTALAPASEIHGGRSNCENPELYAVFPFRLFGVGKTELDVARETFAQRTFRGSSGWQQDDTQAAFLGLAKEAAELVARRFAAHSPDHRFPAFWGPNFDWVPDQDHGGNGLMALQTMLLQWHGRQIFLFPAWPEEWDVEFRLHAPMNTIVEGVYKNRKVEKLLVTPQARLRDVVVVGPH